VTTGGSSAWAAPAARPSQGIYLHFLDRELNEAAGSRLTANQVASLLRLLAAMTSAPLYCGLSGPWENDRISADQIVELEVLFSTGQLELVSHSPTQSEFLDSRRRAYEHDAGRYGRYFQSDRELTWAAPTIVKETGTTGPLVKYLAAWAVEPPPDAEWQPVVFRVRAPVSEALRYRETQAVTWAYFEPHMGDLADNPGARATLRREISNGFTVDYLDHLGGTIATGIRELHAFDRLARVFPDFHVPLLRELASVGGLNALIDRDETNLDTWSRFVELRARDEFRLVAGTASWIIRALFSAEVQRPRGRAEDPDDFYSRPVVVGRMTDALRRAVPYGLRRPLKPSLPPVEQLCEVRLNLERCASRLKAGDATVGSFLESTRSQIMPTEADIVVLVTTPTEFDTMRGRLVAAGGGPQPTVYNGPATYTVYGPIGGTTVALVRSSMGSSGPGGSTLTVSDAVSRLKPWAVVAVGIAFGIDEKDSPIGQVLLSEQLAEYEPQRVGTGGSGELKIVHRGRRTPGSPILLSRFRDSHLDTHGIDVKAGLLLSGEKLIDNADFKDALTEAFPDAIGGEMEGAGVFAATSREGVHVLVVKAVCDYAAQKSDGKEERQATAAAAAADAFMHVLRAGGLVRPAR
jgi:nucleoside phosphorylase